MSDRADVIREALLDVEYPSPQHPEALAALDRLEAQIAKELLRVEGLLEYQEVASEWKTRAVAAEQERDELQAFKDIAAQEIASAMTSLSTGPAKDGYAYSCLANAAAALAKEATDE